jgi:hypothetical protein
MFNLFICGFLRRDRILTHQPTKGITLKNQFMPNNAEEKGSFGANLKDDIA